MRRYGDLDESPPDGIALELDGRKWRLDVEWGLVNGRVEPVRVSVASIDDAGPGDAIDPLPVTADRIRRLSIGKAIAELRRSGSATDYAEWRVQREQDELLALQSDMEMAADYGFGSVSQDMYDAEEAVELRLRKSETLRDATIGPQRGRTRTQLDHEAVASVYIQAHTAGESVTNAIADHFHVSKSTASKRIMAARRAGLLQNLGRAR